MKLLLAIVVAAAAVAECGEVVKLGGLNTYTSGASNATAVILVSDIFGYTLPRLREIADKVGGAGFYAVVPDFFRGAAFVHGWSYKSWIIAHPPEKGIEDAKVVVEALKSKGITKIGGVGFCWGGKVVVDLLKDPLIHRGINERLVREGPASVIMDPFGGKMDKIGESEIPFPHRKGNLFNIQYSFQWGVGDEAKKHLDWSREMYEFMEPYGGGKVVVDLLKDPLIQAGLLIHPTSTTVADIERISAPVSILAGEDDETTRVELIRQFEAALKAKPDVESMVKIFPKQGHGWTLVYDSGNATAVKSAEEAHNDMLHWLRTHLTAAPAPAPAASSSSPNRGLQHLLPPAFFFLLSSFSFFTLDIIIDLEMLM